VLSDALNDCNAPQTQYRTVFVFPLTLERPTFTRKCQIAHLRCSCLLKLCGEYSLPNFRRNPHGFTIVEIMLSVTIAGILALSFMGAIVGLKSRDNIDRATTQIMNDVLMIRSRAISTGQSHRIRFQNSTSWLIERFDAAITPNAWVVASEVRYLPRQTSLMAGSFENAASNLEASSRGVYVFQNSGNGSPYVSIEATGETKTKSLHISVGGAVEVVIN